MKKIAKTVNAECHKLASQGKLDGITPEWLNEAEKRKVAYLANAVVKEVKTANLSIPREIISEIVKTASQYIPAVYTAQPMEKFAAICDNALDLASQEVNTKLNKAAQLDKTAFEKIAETVLNVGTENNPSGEANDPHTPFIEGETKPTADQMAEKPGVEGAGQFLKDMMNKNQASSAIAENETMRYSDDSVGSVDLEETFAMHEGAPIAPGMEGKLAHYKYIDAMDAIKKAAELIEKSLKKTAKEEAPAGLEKVKDSGSVAAVADATKKVQAAEKKPEINSETVDKSVGLTDQAVKTDLEDVLQTVPSKEEPKEPVTEQGVAEQNPSKKASFSIDSLIEQCSSLFSN